MVDPMSNEVLHLLGGLDDWWVSLVGGGEIRIRAFGYSIEEGIYTFSALQHGNPKTTIVLCWIPQSLVAEVRGGVVSDASRELPGPAPYR